LYSGEPFPSKCVDLANTVDDGRDCERAENVQGKIDREVEKIHRTDYLFSNEEKEESFAIATNAPKSILLRRM
jgi:hypothetical protein